MKQAHIDTLLNTPCYLIDILPLQVPANCGGQYFTIDAYFRRTKTLRTFYQKITTILLKLNCYYDFEVHNNKKHRKNPTPENLKKQIKTCINSRNGSISIFVNGENTMIVINGDDLHVSIYNPDKTMKALLRKLTKSEGLFFRMSAIANK